MRKTICALVAASVMTMAAPAIGDELKVGDKMMDYKTGNKLYGKGLWVSPDSVKKGVTERYTGEDGILNYAAGHLFCDGEKVELPFGVYVFETNTLYRDNAPTDGIIDSIQKGNIERVYDTAPDCPSKL